MSNKKMELMKDLPEDSEAMKQIIESDNPGYELEEVEKEYREDIAQWYFFCRMKLKKSTTLSTRNSQLGDNKRKRAKPK